MNELPTIVSFWHGPLSWLERLCITSFIRQGHPFALYTYDPVEGLPDGAERRDAQEILPRDELTFYKGHGTPAVFANWFRLMLLQQGRGFWADCDVYCVRPFVGMGDYVFAYERPNSINNAVLFLPSDAPVLDDLMSLFTQTERPLFEPHLPLFRRLEVAAKRLVGQKVGPEYMQFGTGGPAMLNYHFRRHGLAHLALPSEVFYPVPYKGIPALMKAGSPIEAHITERTHGVHIWRSQLTRRGRVDIATPEPGSALDRLCKNEGI